MNETIENKCCICQRVYRLRKIKDEIYCYTHYNQIRKHGCIIRYGRGSPNEFVLKVQFAEIVLYNKAHIEVARTIIDLDDVDLCKKYRWVLNGRNEVFTDIDNKKVKLHRLLLNPQDDLVVDHINRNKLDNRRSNLRICTIAQNNYNKGLRKENTSGITGVDWDKSRRKWRVQIGYDNKNHFVGRFDKLEDAIKAREEAELKHFGEFSPKCL